MRLRHRNSSYGNPKAQTSLSPLIKIHNNRETGERDSVMRGAINGERRKARRRFTAASFLRFQGGAGEAGSCDGASWRVWNWCEQGPPAQRPTASPSDPPSSRRAAGAVSGHR